MTTTATILSQRAVALTEAATAEREKWLPLTGPDSLTSRAESAARYVLRGNYRDARGDAEQQIIAATLAKLTPERSDPQQRRGPTAYRVPTRSEAEREDAARVVWRVLRSDKRAGFPAMVNAARDYLDVLRRTAEREQQRTQEQDERAAAENTATLADQIAAERAESRENAERDALRNRALASEQADAWCHLLSRAPDSLADGDRYRNLWRVAYTVARGGDEHGKQQQIAAELELEAATLKQSKARARSVAASRYGNPQKARAGLLALLPWDAVLVLDTDRSTAHNKRRAGNSLRLPNPDRTPDADPVRATCIDPLRYLGRGLLPTPERTAQQTGEALTRQAAAWRAALR